MRRFWGAMAAALLAASCSPGEGPKSIPLPTPETTLAPEPTTPPEPTTTTVPESTSTTSTTDVPPRYSATIRRTTDGVPHITADDPAGLFFGQGWASAEDHGCSLIDQILKVTGRRSARLGPGVDGENIESDFGWRAIGLGEIAADDFDDAPDDVIEMFTAFAAGWNDYLASTGEDSLTGWCTGADWVRPIQPVEAYTYARSLALLASSARMVDYVAAAAPPETGAAEGFRTPSRAELPGDPLGTADLGSNGWAVGRERTESGTGGMLVGNPHFPWEGELRFAEVHLQLRGEIDMYGAQLLGVPGVGIGFNEGVAWTHTVSAGKRMTAYSLTLDPASPTTYLVDGDPTEMTSTDYTVEILRPDGTLDTETRTLWRSEYGPIIDYPGLEWSTTRALTFRDANLDNDEFVEQNLAQLRMESLDDLIALNEEYQGVPLFNTVATGADGSVWYADTSATPNLSDDGEQLFIQRLFNDPLTQLAWDGGIALLDGSDSRFQWVDEPGARDPGLIPYSGQPQVTRTDYVFNANGSYWVPSDEFTLDGDFSVLQGEHGTPQSQRTRRNAAVLSADNRSGLSGDDGLFTIEELRDATFDNTGQLAALLRAHAVAACQASPSVTLPELLDDDDAVVFEATTIDLTETCQVLADWDGRYNLDSMGAIVWRETMARFTDDERTNTGPLFSDTFDAAAPTRTPAEPAAMTTPLLQAMGRALQSVEAAGFDTTSTLGSAQFTERSGDRIALHGGTNIDGVTNIVSWSANSTSTEPAPTRGEPVAPGGSLRGSGYPVNYGTSFVFAVELGAEQGNDDPVAWALLTYGQTGDRESELFEIQTVRFSEKAWRRVAYTDEQIEADPQLTEEQVAGG